MLHKPGVLEMKFEIIHLHKGKYYNPFIANVILNNDGIYTITVMLITGELFTFSTLPYSNIVRYWIETQ